MDGDSPGPLEPIRKRYAFICNGRAGRGLRPQPLGHIEQTLRGLGHETCQFPCHHSLETTASEAVRDGFTTIVAVGGDGTVSGCAAAVWKAGSGVTLGVLPAGTLNHFARDLGIFNLSIGEAALAGDRIRPVDIGTVNGLPFINNASIGLYPVIVRKREGSRRAGIPRWTAFFWAVVRTLLRLPLRRLTIEADGQSRLHRTPFLFVGNNEYRLEGIQIGTRERLDQGLLDVCASGGSGRLALLRLALRALFGKLREERDFWNITARQLTVRTRHSSLQVTLDGELNRLRAPLNFLSHPGELPVLVPPVAGI